MYPKGCTNPAPRIYIYRLYSWRELLDNLRVNAANNNKLTIIINASNVIRSDKIPGLYLWILLLRDLLALPRRRHEAEGKFL